MVSAIIAVSDNMAIGLNNLLPWPHISEDMKWFRKHTEENIVIMGRNTWQSIGLKPLKNRTNIVVSTNLEDRNIQIIRKNILEEIKLLELGNPNKEIFIIGGKKLYEETWPIVNRIYVTRIRNNYAGDKTIDIDIILENFQLIESEFLLESNNYPALEFQIWNRNE